MQIVSHSPEFAKKVDIDQKVAKRFIKDDEASKQQTKQKAADSK